MLDALYERADPWNLASPHEKERFAATNALIATHAPHCGSLLEIGSGEGLQTRELLRVARHVTGIEGSVTALARARETVPDATFLVGDFGRDIPEIQGSHYDLVTMCEVLYYIDEPEAALSRAQALADMVLVTIYEPRAASLKALFLGPGWQALPSINAGDRRWKAYLWRNIKTNNL